MSIGALPHTPKRAFGSLAKLVLSFVIGLSVQTERAHAQVALEQFKPAPLSSDGFALSRPEVLGHLKWNVWLVGDYAKNPLVAKVTPFTPYGTPSASSSTLSLVEHHLVLHAGAAVGLGSRFTLFGSLPVHVLMKGDTPPSSAVAADGAGLGDVALGGRLRLVGTNDTVFAMSAELIARLPTAELANGDQNYSGDKIGSYEPAVVPEVHLGPVDLRIRVGARLRKEVDFPGLTIGNELLYGFGARVRLIEQLYLHGELYGATPFSDFLAAKVSPVELLVGPKANVGDWFFGVAAGPGFGSGFGTPDARVVASIGVAPRDKPPAPTDSDRDGLLDPDDRCPREPEDRDSFEDEDGCPDPDNDGDGVLDADDRCASAAEDRDSFEDTDGCPEPDNDHDGVLDAVDQCPTEPEDKDGFEDEDGCPELDNDRDGIADGDDKCPLEPGVAEEQGCPKSIVNEETGVIAITDRVEFETRKDVILPTSETVLNQIKSLLDTNLRIKRIRVEGHTDDVGKDAKNLDLSKRRATSVGRWLTEHGIAADRLEAWGCGETRPLEKATTPEARQTNRRVEFHVVDPAPPEPRSTEGCSKVELK